MEWLIIFICLLIVPLAFFIALIRWLWYKGSNEKKRKQNQE